MCLPCELLIGHPWHTLHYTRMQNNHVIRIVTTSGDATEVFVGNHDQTQYSSVRATLLILHLRSYPHSAAGYGLWEALMNMSVSGPPRPTVLALASVHLQLSGLAVGPVTGNLYFSE
jgi:hypothetical protein